MVQLDAFIEVVAFDMNPNDTFPVELTFCRAKNSCHLVIMINQCDLVSIGLDNVKQVKNLDAFCFDQVVD